MLLLRDGWSLLTACNLLYIHPALVVPPSIEDSSMNGFHVKFCPSLKAAESIEKWPEARLNQTKRDRPRETVSWEFKK